MDGLVSNAALIAGVAGGTRSADGAAAIVLAGLAGLAAGAFSMAAGEYASAASQAEPAEFEVATHRRDIIENPGPEQAALSPHLAAPGPDEPLAHDATAQVAPP